MAMAKTAKKTQARKATTTRTATRKAAKPAARSVNKAARPAAAKAVKKAAPMKAFKEAPTKTEILNTISEYTELTRKQVAQVFDCLAEMIASSIKPKMAGEFTIPSLMKIKIVRKPATKARKGINPFTGEETMFQAKPARNVVKIKALKKLKTMAE